ncbi:UAA transporter [Lentinus tigrinus ALCF2SS1-7]|uniref:UAA transporter n=1 Tax=Lentinus tigrinus ALCF2SS1-6 TaxID=1328759 RepID=A0A5C2SFK1_9APHY|nr:UAA transporter [Lentinus tigrinus ALCF2SS1-6]RPD74576.1 UAA transporter [Lentinus tigrinus ALCF2SS1-7]
MSIHALTLATISDWTAIFTLIFGGCCSNALTLEQLTRAHPNAGSLITFAQFITISIQGLPRFLTTTRWHGLIIPRLRKRKIPLKPYFVQVALFYGISLLNNMAFGYKIPMPVHIIFRSGGLVVSMVMGWAFAGRRYNTTQVASVLLVTAGVILTTLSASGAKARTGSSSATSQSGSSSQYATGIAILTLALILGGALGLAQDWTYNRYTRSPIANPQATVTKNGYANGSVKDPQTDKADSIQPWQESMFYLHFLSLPMFLFVRQDLAGQASALHASEPLRVTLSASAIAPESSSLLGPLMPTLYPPFGLMEPLTLAVPFLDYLKEQLLEIPSGYIPLTLTSLTSVVCVAGVNRLTARVSSLTVTLVLVVRKAVSMVISVFLFGAKGGQINTGMMWAGAALVFLGTMGYAAGSRKGKRVDTNTMEGQKTKKE